MLQGHRDLKKHILLCDIVESLKQFKDACGSWLFAACAARQWFLRAAASLNVGAASCCSRHATAQLHLLLQEGTTSVSCGGPRSDYNWGNNSSPKKDSYAPPPHKEDKDIRVKTSGIFHSSRRQLCCLQNARQPGSQAARQPERQAARQPGSQAARQPGSQAASCACCPRQVVDPLEFDDDTTEAPSVSVSDVFLFMEMGKVPFQADVKSVSQRTQVVRKTKRLTGGEWQSEFCFLYF